MASRRDPDRSPPVGEEADFVTGVGAVSLKLVGAGTPALKDEVRSPSVKGQSVEVPFPHETDEAEDVCRGEVRVERDLDGSSPLHVQQHGSPVHSAKLVPSRERLPGQRSWRCCKGAAVPAFQHDRDVLRHRRIVVRQKRNQALGQARVSQLTNALQQGSAGVPPRLPLGPGDALERRQHERCDFQPILSAFQKSSHRHQQLRVVVRELLGKQRVHTVSQEGEESLRGGASHVRHGVLGQRPQNALVAERASRPSRVGAHERVRMPDEVG